MFRRQALIVILFVLVLRLPFLNQAIQGDDLYYLAGAQHAQIDPLHPNHAEYSFHGEMVSMQGHPHPPFNAWYLGAVLAVVKDIREIPFHAAYLPFSLIAGLSALSIARCFSDRHALKAALLFCSVPAFVVNGNSLESDIPLLAFWLLSVALFLAGRYILAIPAMLLAAFCGYQSMVLVPILALHLWQQRERARLPWLVLLTIPVSLGAWQLWERVATGAMPAQVLTGYFTTYGLQRLPKKLANAAALSAHMGWLVCPLAALLVFRRAWRWAVIPALAAAWFDASPLCWGSVFIGVLVIAGSVRRGWLGAWVGIFFAASLVLFFAGSARYLLPLALPVCILAAEHVGRWAILAHVPLGLLLAFVNYQHWDGYRRFAAAMSEETQAKRVWVNGEWGLRHYLEADGALPLLRGQAVQPGEIVVTSQLGFPISFTTGGGMPVPVRLQTITTSIPLRLIGLNSKSAYSTASENALRPFDFGAGPIDVVREDAVTERRPELSYLHMGSAEASGQIVSGMHELENDQWRWMSGRAVVLLKRPAIPAPLEVKLYIPDEAPGRQVTIAVDGQPLLSRVLDKPGIHSLRTAPVAGEQVVLTIDKTFQAPNDNRRLGMIVVELGYR